MAAAGLATRALTGTTTALDTDDWLFVSGASSAWALTLMSVATRTRPLWVFLTDATHAVTVTHGASDTINGAATLVLSTLHQWVCLKPPPTGTDWAALVAGGSGTAFSPTWTAISTTGTISTATTNELVDTTAGNITRTLPTPSGGMRVTVKKKDSSGHTVTVAGTIDGGTNFVLSSQYDSITVVWDGSVWWIE